MNNCHYASGKYNLINKYRHFLRLEASRYLDEYDDVVVWGDGLINDAYILIFAVKNEEEYLGEDFYSFM